MKGGVIRLDLNPLPPSAALKAQGGKVEPVTAAAAAAAAAAAPVASAAKPPPKRSKFMCVRHLEVLPTCLIFLLLLLGRTLARTT